MICSPSGFCASLSCSMVSCGKRGSLLVAGAANMVAANQPPAAATTSDDIQTEAEFMDSLRVFFIAAEMLVQPRGPRQSNDAPEMYRVKRRRYRPGTAAPASCGWRHAAVREHPY